MKYLLKKNLPELLRFSTAISGNKFDAEDLMQTAIERIIKKYPDIKENSEFLRLSYKIIRNLLIDKKRKKKREISEEELGNINQGKTLEMGEEKSSSIGDYIEFKARDIDEEIKYKTMNAEGNIIEKEINILKYKKYEIAKKCLSELENENQKNTLILFSEGLKYEDISLRLELPKGTVMSSLARARLKVADCIKKRFKNV